MMRYCVSVVRTNFPQIRIRRSQFAIKFLNLINSDYLRGIVMNCKQLIICKKPESNLSCSNENTVAEETNPSPVKLCTVH